MKYDTPEDIPDAVVERMKHQKTYIAMARRRARDKGINDEMSLDLALTDDDWRQIYWDKSKRREQYYKKVQVPQRVEVDMEELKPGPGVVTTKLQEYLEYYQDPAPNDLLTIQQLISMQEQLDTIDKQIAEILEQDPIPLAKWRDLARIQRELSGETRQLQDMLGISRKAREAKKHDEELADRLTANIDQARQLIDDYGVKLICPHCEATEGQRIMQGFVIHHFPESGFEIKTTCPVCKQLYAISKRPEKWGRHAEQNPLLRQG